jgi:hypothetical protein
MKKYKTLLFILCIAIYASLSLQSGCSDDPITPIVKVDSNIAIKSGIVVNESQNDNSLCGINLYLLQLETRLSTEKDGHFYDSLGERTNFQIRTGDLVDDKRFAGLQTKFDFIYYDLSKSRFDTLKKMYYDHTVDPLTDFPYNNTDYYILPLTTKPVWAFYLKGRYDYGYNQGRRIYGLLQIDSLYNLNDTFRIKLNIKINKNGTDQFNPNHE